MCNSQYFDQRSLPKDSFSKTTGGDLSLHQSRMYYAEQQSSTYDTDTRQTLKVVDSKYGSKVIVIWGVFIMIQGVCTRSPDYSWQFAQDDK
jgi:hypothetical protein